MAITTAAITEAIAGRQRSARRQAAPASSAMRRCRRVACAAFVAAGLLMAFEGVAEERTLYKSVLPNGEVVYSDTPAPNARRATAISVEPHPPNAEDSKAAQQALAVRREQLLRDAAARAARITQLDRLIGNAYGELEAAEWRREQGRAMLEGDRQGRRLSANYSQRQQSLDAATWKVRQRLDVLLSERSALRY